MRIKFSTTARPKRASKLHSRVTGLKLRVAQNEVAFILGYGSWMEMDRAAESLVALKEPRSPDDEDISPAEVMARRAYQAGRLREHRLISGLPPVSPEEAAEIIDKVRPSARVPGGPRSEFLPAIDMSDFPGALISVLSEAAAMGAHKVHIHDKGENSSGTNLWFRVLRPLVRGRSRTAAEIREIVDWVETVAAQKYVGLDEGYGEIPRLAIDSGGPVSLGIARLAVQGGRVVVFSIRRQGAAGNLASLGFMPDQIEMLDRHIRTGGGTIISGTVGNGGHTTIRSLTALYPKVPFHGDVTSDVWGGKDGVLKKVSSGFVKMHARSALAVASELFFRLPRERWDQLVRSQGPSIMVVHQHLLPVLCPHCRIPAAGKLSGRKAFQIETTFGIKLNRVFLRNEAGCEHCIASEYGKPVVPGYTRREVVAEMVDVGGFVAAAIAKGEDGVAAFRATRKAPYDSPVTQGKTSLEVAMCGVADGSFDIRDVETEIEQLDWFLGLEPHEIELDPVDLN